MLFSSAKTTSHLLNTGATSNLYLTDLLRNYPLLTITYKIILRSLRLLSWFLLQSRIWVYFYITDGWSVYPGFIPEGDQIISKTYMTRVEGENTRLRHYLTRLHRKTLCYSKSEEMLRHSLYCYYTTFNSGTYQFRRDSSLDSVTPK
jgi:IS1 family transposase